MTAEENLIASLGIPVERTFFDVRGARMHCVVAGSGPKLILLHGLNIGWGEWHLVLPTLARKFTVMAVDLPGAGNTKSAGATFADLPQTLRAAVDGFLRVAAPEGATVVAHSVAGWAAMKLAAEGHPSIRALVVVDGVGFSDFVPPRFRLLRFGWLASVLAKTVVRPDRAHLRDFFTDVMSNKASLDDRLVDYYVEHVRRPPHAHPFMLIRRLLDGTRIRAAFILTTEELAAISVPALILHGKNDPLIPADAVMRAAHFLKRAKIEILEEVGHVPPVEDVTRFAASVSAFADANAPR